MLHLRQKDETDNRDLYSTVVTVSPGGLEVEVETRFALDLIENAIENAEGELPEELDKAIASIRMYLLDPDAWHNDTEIKL